MTETELTRRVVETAAKFIVAEPSGVREVSVSLRDNSLMEMSPPTLRLMRAIGRDSVALGWKSRQSFADVMEFRNEGTLTTKFYAPKTNTL
jgi:hypothetical protein